MSELITRQPYTLPLTLNPPRNELPSVEDELSYVLRSMYATQEGKLRDATLSTKQRLGEIHDLQNVLAKLRQEAGSKKDTDSINFNEIGKFVIHVDEDSPLSKSLDPKGLQSKFDALFAEALKDPGVRVDIASWGMDLSTICISDGHLSAICLPGNKWGWIGDRYSNGVTSGWGRLDKSALMAAKAELDAAMNGDMTLGAILRAYGIDAGSPKNVKELNVLIETVKTKTDSLSQSSQLDLINLNNWNSRFNESGSTYSDVLARLHDGRMSVIQNLK